VHTDKGLGDGAAQLGVHGERRALPVDRRTHLAQLRVDAVAVLFLPLPHSLNKLFAPEVVAGLALFGHDLFLDDDLFYYCQYYVTLGGMLCTWVAMPA